MKVSLSILLMSSEQWSGLLWSSVPGGWPASGTLQTGLHPPEGSVGTAGKNATQQQRLRRGGLGYCNRCITLFSTTVLFDIKPSNCSSLSPILQLSEVIFPSSSVIHSLLDICCIISNLDMALHGNTWKFLIKSVLQINLWNLGFSNDAICHHYTRWTTCV